MKTSNNYDTSVTIAERYYLALEQKDLITASSLLHPDVVLISPLAEITTKPVVIKALEGFLHAIEKLEIRLVSDMKEKAILILDPYFLPPIGKLRTASLITLESNLIKSIELFYDGSPFGVTRNIIFEK